MNRSVDVKLFGLILSLAPIVFSSPVVAEVYLSSSNLGMIKSRGEITITIPQGPTTYYHGPHGPSGYEYDLARAFAESLGVELKVVVADDTGGMIPAPLRGDADLAAGLAPTPSRQQHARFGPGYQEVISQVVYRADRPAPESIEDLIGKRILVVAGSVQAEQLAALKDKYPNLEWAESEDLDYGEILHGLLEGAIDYTIVNSDRMMLSLRYHPELKIAFELGESRQLAWALPKKNKAKSSDDSLYHAVVKFFEEIEENGKLAQIEARYYGHAARMGYFGTLTFMQHIDERLPDYRNLFEQAAKKHQLDWRMLAAMSYQESLWNAEAVSPTGVRGLMMLTLATATQLGIENRADPRQSIAGGAEYYNIVKAKVPERIPEPDRSWMAMAAYNIGFGHLEDARILTEKLGGDPDKWIDVAQHLPLLSKEEWCKETQYGCARGNEPVDYVLNVRNYYDILVWATERELPGEDGTEFAALEMSLDTKEKTLVKN